MTTENEGTHDDRSSIHTEWTHGGGMLLGDFLEMLGKVCVDTISPVEKQIDSVQLTMSDRLRLVIAPAETGHVISNSQPSIEFLLHCLEMVVLVKARFDSNSRADTYAGRPCSKTR